MERDLSRATERDGGSERYKKGGDEQNNGHRLSIGVILMTARPELPFGPATRRTFWARPMPIAMGVPGWILVSLCNLAHSSRRLREKRGMLGHFPLLDPQAGQSTNQYPRFSSQDPDRRKQMAQITY